jgi:hypothetical protein
MRLRSRLTEHGRRRVYELRADWRVRHRSSAAVGHMTVVGVGHKSFGVVVGVVGVVGRRTVAGVGRSFERVGSSWIGLEPRSYSGVVKDYCMNWRVGRSFVRVGSRMGLRSFD